MIELEKSLLELNEIFNEMAVMMESQGGSENPDDSIKDQTLDGIEDNVGGAQEYVERGKQQLAKAEEHKKILKIKKYDPDNHFVGGCSDNCAVLDSNIHITSLQ